MMMMCNVHLVGLRSRGNSSTQTRYLQRTPQYTEDADSRLLASSKIRTNDPGVIAAQERAQPL
jgi:hypothetical protein